MADAAAGVPAHVTLLYPFAPPGSIDDLRGTIESIAANHQPFQYRLVGPAAWPDTIYVTVDPPEPFAAIHRDLATAFPDYPIYGGAFESFVPHVTVAERLCPEVPESLRDGGALPVARVAGSIDLISEGADRRWSLSAIFPLGH